MNSPWIVVRRDDHERTKEQLAEAKRELAVAHARVAELEAKKPGRPGIVGKRKP